MIIVRYADDVVIGFEQEHDARRFLDAMRARFEEFKLSESWPRLSEQFPAKDKWRSAGFGLQRVAGRLSRCRAGVAQPELRQMPGGGKFRPPS